MPKIKPSRTKLIRADIDSVIRKACVLRGLRQADLLKSLGISDTTLMRRRKEPERWRVNELRKLALYADMDILEVFQCFIK